jgi:hypothetical protein
MFSRRQPKNEKKCLTTISYVGISKNVSKLDRIKLIITVMLAAVEVFSRIEIPSCFFHFAQGNTHWTPSLPFLELNHLSIRLQPHLICFCAFLGYLEFKLIQ